MLAFLLSGDGTVFSLVATRAQLPLLLAQFKTTTTLTSGVGMTGRVASGAKAGTPVSKQGVAIQGHVGAGASKSLYQKTGTSWGARTATGTRGQSPAAAGYPQVLLGVSFATDPLLDPAYSDVSTSRGRSWEYDRMEAGTAQYQLSNRDSRFNPLNSSGPYYPNVLPSRRVTASVLYNGHTYPLFAGFAEGYPQMFVQAGADATVQQQATDWWFVLQQLKFPNGQLFPQETTGSRIDRVLGLAGVALADRNIAVGQSTVSAVGSQTAATGVATGDGGAISAGESVTIGGTVYSFATTLTSAYQVLLNANVLLNLKAAVNGETGAGTVYGAGTAAHPTVSCTVVTSNTLTLQARAAGVAGNNIATVGPAHLPFAEATLTGGTVTSPLDNTSLLEHILLMGDVEQGRLFVSAAGVVTFIDRHQVFKTELTSRGTFGDGGGSELPYAADPPPTVNQDESRIFNSVRITLDDQTVVTSRSQASIGTYFERTLEKTLPYADVNEAQDAADYAIYRLASPQTRISELTLKPQSAAALWPVALGVELGQRWTFKLRPKGGGTIISRDVIVDGVSHDSAPSVWQTKLRLVPADPQTYWILENATYGILDSNTRLAF
jgi:hypothetical protein